MLNVNLELRKSVAIERIISDFLGKALDCFSPPASLLTVYDLLCKDYGTFTLESKRVKKSNTWDDIDYETMGIQKRNIKKKVNSFLN